MIWKVFFFTNSHTHYKNPMVKFLFFFSFFVALNSLILNQQSRIIYLLKKPRFFQYYSDKLRVKNYEFKFLKVKTIDYNLKNYVFLNN